MFNPGKVESGKNRTKRMSFLNSNMVLLRKVVWNPNKRTILVDKLLHSGFRVRVEELSP